MLRSCAESFVKGVAPPILDEDPSLLQLHDLKKKLNNWDGGDNDLSCFLFFIQSGQMIVIRLYSMSYFVLVKLSNP